MSDDVLTRSERLDRLIEAWHISGTHVQLHDYLGWTADEYARWVETNVMPPEREHAA